MILGKAIFLASVLLPFAPKGLARGSRAFQQPSPSSMPVEPLCPSDATSICSPREGVPLAPHLRLVHDASASWPDVSQNSVTSQSYWEKIETLKSASTRNFVRWLRRHDVSGAVSQRELLALYLEFSEFSNRKPLTERQLLNTIKKHGVETFRPAAHVVDGKLHRPTRYRLKPIARRAA